ncbi:MAG: hypothetical protein SNJ70_07425 [Armatimonadota bacterium]
MNEDVKKGQGENLVVVYKAEDQFIADIIKGILEGDKIPVVLESMQVPWLNGVMKMAEGYWGNVVVPIEYEKRAKELIEAYHKELKESKTDDE